MKKRRFKVFMRRREKTFTRRGNLFTHAFSKAQARRFAFRRYPGWSVTRVVED